jgi:hypothetical protein
MIEKNQSRYTLSVNFSWMDRAAVNGQADAASGTAEVEFSGRIRDA